MAINIGQAYQPSGIDISGARVDLRRPLQEGEWFRVLRDNELAALYAQNRIDTNEASNRCICRDVKDCSGATVTPTCPSIWARKITNSWCKDTYLDRPWKASELGVDKIFFPQFSTMKEDVSGVSGMLKDQRVFAFWNTESRRWEADILHGTIIAYPLTRIDPAPSDADPSKIKMTHGTARLIVHDTTVAHPNYTLIKAAASWQDIHVYNMHDGMWLWDNVHYEFWTEPRSGRCVARNLAIQPVILGVVAPLAIPAGNHGIVQVWRDAVPSGSPGAPAAVAGLTVDAYHDWMAGGVALSAGLQCLVKWFPEGKRWRIIEAECPPEETP